MNKNLKKRLQSFAWRLAGMIAVVVLNQVAEFSTTLSLDPSTTVVVGLIVGECTKYLNTELKK